MIRCRTAGLRVFLLSLTLLFSLLYNSASLRADPSNPIVFVTQPPWPSDFGTINATLGNQLASMDAAPRGGDLYIRYPNGTLKNLTAAAGYGNSGLQGANSIAVRDPSVSWDGSKVIFSMVVGAPTQQYQVNSYRWQLYEISGLASSETPVISKVANQPTQFNNIYPIYGTDDRIVFISDRPRNGAAHLYPQRDEYESFPTNTGLWSLNPANGDLKILDHSPSGDFSPIIDSYGRVIFTRWDHLQRDQQNRCSNSSFQAFNYTDESASASALDSDLEIYPEARGECDRNGVTNLDLHTLNHFLPWQINEDGTEMETLNHVGRHELVGYLGKSFNDDSNVMEFYGQYTRLNQNPITNFFQIVENPAALGNYYGIDAPEFGTHAAGQIIKINGAPSVLADQMQITYITHEDTSGIDDTPSADHIGLSRDPLLLADGSLWASHTSSTQQDANIGTGSNPQSRYSFRIKQFNQSGAHYLPAANLTSGIQKTVSFWSPDQLVSFNSVTMWELQAKEVVARTTPAQRSAELPQIEASVFEELGISVAELKEFLLENSLAMVISRNVTTRDKLDRQQPVNLKIEDSETVSKPFSGKLYNVAHLQFFQGDQVRGYAGSSSTTGRRVIAQSMHEVTQNPDNANGPAGSVKIASDGSMAAFVPASRAMTYQLTDSAGEGVVRERFWLTFQAGEIRVCASCHGVNSQDHLGHASPVNQPEALRLLLQHWKSMPNERPTFTLKLPKSLRAGKKAKLSVQGNSLAKNKTVSLSLKVNSKQCGTIGSFVMNSEGIYQKNLKVPRSSKGAKLEFKLLYLGAVKDSAKAKLKAESRSAQNLAANKICKAFKLK